jgi:hypothetical protein
MSCDMCCLCHETGHPRQLSDQVKINIAPQHCQRLPDLQPRRQLKRRQIEQVLPQGDLIAPQSRPEYVLGCRPRRMEALVGRRFAVEFGNEIRAGFQCLAGASLGELGEKFAALRIACLDEFNRLTLDVGEFLGPALL